MQVIKVNNAQKGDKIKCVYSSLTNIREEDESIFLPPDVGILVIELSVEVYPSSINY